MEFSIKLTRDEIFSQYPDLLVDIITWIKACNKWRRNPKYRFSENIPHPPMMVGCEELTKSRIVCSEPGWIQELERLKINWKNPQRHHELRRFLNG